MNQTIESLRFVRAVVGFLRAGVFVQPPLLARAAKIVEQTNEAMPADGQAALRRVAEVLKTAQAAILPSQASCTDGMAEIDALLIPMRQAQRSVEAAARNLLSGPANADDAPVAHGGVARPVSRG